MRDDQLLRYARHILLNDLGIEGQQALLDARVLIVGAGGLGSPVCLYLASAGVGHLEIVDDDHVELSNLQRQIMHTTAGLGQMKADSAKEAISALNPDTVITTHTSRADTQALERLVVNVDLVVDCCDNFETRHAINQACVTHGVPLVSGAAIQFEGQLAVYDVRDPESPCYHCLFPKAQDVAPVSCATMGVYAPLVGIIGSLQAAEAIKVLTGLGRPLLGRLVMFDVRQMRWHEVKVPRDKACSVCRVRPGENEPVGDIVAQLNHADH